MKRFYFIISFCFCSILSAIYTNKAYCQKHNNLVIIDGSGALLWEDYLEIGKTIAKTVNQIENTDSLITTNVQKFNPECVTFNYPVVDEDTVSLCVCQSLNYLLGQYQKADVAILYVHLVYGPSKDINEIAETAKRLGIRKMVVFMDRNDLVQNDEMINYCERKAQAALDFAGIKHENTYYFRGSFEKAKSNISEKNPYLIKLLEMMVLISTL